MQISFADLKLLLEETQKHNCVVFIDGYNVDRIVCLDDLIVFEEGLKQVKVIENFDIKVSLEKDLIHVEESGYDEHYILVYKQPMTKEEYLTTLEFLKND